MIVHSDADIAYASERIAWGGFSYAGQSCTSVQRVYAHSDIYESFLDQLILRMKALVVGDPLDEATDVGPLIDRRAAERVETWVNESKQGGAKVLVGGTRRDTLWQPTLLASLHPAMRVSCQEVFAPLVCIYCYDDMRDAISDVNDSEFGLQAGLFTNDSRAIQDAFDRIQVGTLNVNDVSSFRADQMPMGV